LSLVEGFQEAIGSQLIVLSLLLRRINFPLVEEFIKLVETVLGLTVEKVDMVKQSGKEVT